MPAPLLIDCNIGHLRPDARRVLLRPFKPAVEPRDRNHTDEARSNRIIARIMAMAPREAEAELGDVMAAFNGRHRGLLGRFESRAAEMTAALDRHPDFSLVQRQLAGSCFLQEYAFESVALFNPSVVAHPDQTDVPPGGLRFILSLRAVGEGHVSSLTFRTGVLTATGQVSVDVAARTASTPHVVSRTWGEDGDDVVAAFEPDSDISERVIFPITASQSNGLEDARFVRFKDGTEEGYYATYTAYSGHEIRSELLETRDFVTFRLTPLRGAATRNKGMALFPRKIDGRYAMIARQDNENLYLIYSEDLHGWHEGCEILRPCHPWEFVQIGNCGSPIELDEGWLVLTHGVGAVRQYAIGAVLLDKGDPSRVIGRTRFPLIRPDPLDREGYVPNVVYTCGALRHQDRILLPYGVSDTTCKIATLEISDLIERLRG